MPAENVNGTKNTKLPTHCEFSYNPTSQHIRTNNMTEITWLQLSWCALPLLFACTVFYFWNGKILDVLYGAARMLIQLIAVGYALVAIFNHASPVISGIIVLTMLCAASWIAIRPVKHHKGIFIPAAISLGGSVLIHLTISILLILSISDWYTPNVLIPLAGMYLANSMNSISLTTERFFSELKNGKPIDESRSIAFNAAMIPQMNALLAVGLVALPGMMTGQILSGVSPLVAVRYQIMIMTMILGTTAVASSFMLWLLTKRQVSSTSTP